MANRLIALAAHPVWTELNPDPGDVLYTHIDDAQGRHLYICGGRNDPAGVVVGDHDQTTGEPAAGLDLTEYNELLPTGNIDGSISVVINGGGSSCDGSYFKEFTLLQIIVPEEPDSTKWGHGLGR